MRPALQRLVARPSGRELLRLLVGDERAVGCFAPAALDSGRRHHPGKLFRNGVCLRKYSGVAVAIKEYDLGTQVVEKETGEGTREGTRERVLPQLPREDLRTPKTLRHRSKMGVTSAAHTRGNGSVSRPEIVLSTDTTISVLKPPAGKHLEKQRTQWKDDMFSHARLEFESNLDVPLAGDQQRLLDTNLQNDALLWIMLLGYRKRIYGMEGVRTFWNAIQERDILLPKQRHLADKFWRAFLTLGFKDPEVLESIYQYAKRNKDRYDVSWSTLYPDIVGHFLVHHQGELALKWHNLLRNLQQPGLGIFAEMCRDVVSKDGDLSFLKQIYNTQPHRSLYSSIIPLFCRKTKYSLALEWHSFLFKNGDAPEVANTAQALVAHLSIFDPPSARKVTSDLVQANSAFAPLLSRKLEEYYKITREVMNKLHGETLHIPAKKYNDELGARWFATTWVSVDVAINGIQALGIQEIGPLSLQAIALRNPDPKAVISRIEQLEEEGVSIGSSLFSRAIKHFSQDGKSDLLETLLKSDEHPDEFENFELQEALLASYAEKGDWTLYRMTFEIRLLASKSPEFDRRNIELRMVASTSDKTASQQELENMLMDGVPVTGQTISLLLKSTLGPRRPGHRPVATPAVEGRSERRAFYDSIEMLKSIMRSGTRVHPNQWHEIIKRIGMSGDMAKLRHLCSWLAKCYGPENHNSTELWLRRLRIPEDVPTSHKLHPLRILFPARLQKAIIEWGFIASRPQHIRHMDLYHVSIGLDAIKQTPATMTSGIYLLKKLNSLGVHIDTKSVRKAIVDRLITYYGPGYSNRRHNERRARKMGSLENAAKEIDQALGGEYFTTVGLSEIVHWMAMVRWRRRERRLIRRPELMGRDPRSRFLLGKGATAMPRLNRKKRLAERPW
ncbi:hypothetical protein VTL71DRAFT_3705 [Oculimacula yallundae]|uniref:Pentatricopeptide repeat domain-containing protein n=1 Tax=Oculimacula yallundae TaxID=86028 RepID=A0ABR4C647_9HELO